MAMTIQIRGTNLFFTETNEVLKYLRDNDLHFVKAEIETGNSNNIIIDTRYTWEVQL